MLCWEVALRPSIWGWDLICQRLLGLPEEQQPQNVVYFWLSGPCIQKSAARFTKPWEQIFRWYSNLCKIIELNSFLESSKRICTSLWFSTKSNDHSMNSLFSFASSWSSVHYRVDCRKCFRPRALQRSSKFRIWCSNILVVGLWQGALNIVALLAGRTFLGLWLWVLQMRGLWHPI